MDHYRQLDPPLFIKEDGSLTDYLCEHLPERSIVMVRERLHTSNEKAEEYRTICRGFEVLNDVPGVKRMLECVIGQPDGVRTFLVEEGDYKSLSDWIMEIQNPLGMDEFWELRRSLLDTLRAVHSKSIAHGGLTPSSIYLSQNTWKVGDFSDNSWMWHCNAEQLVSDYSCPELKAYERPQDWYQADMYSTGLILFFAVTGKIPQDISPDSQIASQQIFQAIAEARLREDVANIICSMMFPPLSLPPQPQLKAEESLVKTEEPEDYFVCSFCTEETGMLTPQGVYQCMNPNCEKHENSAQLELHFQAISLQPAVEAGGAAAHAQLQPEMNPANVHPQQLQAGAVLAADVPKAAENSEPPPLKPCISCSRQFQSKQRRWNIPVKQIPATILSDICSLFCFEKYCNECVLPNETRNRCMECFSHVTSQTVGVKKLTCNAEHSFCSQKCWRKYRLLNYYCPRCHNMLNLVEADKEGCCCCGNKEGLQEFKCGHRNCLKCLSKQD